MWRVFEDFTGIDLQIFTSKRSYSFISFSLNPVFMSTKEHLSTEEARFKNVPASGVIQPLTGYSSARLMGTRSGGLNSRCRGPVYTQQLFLLARLQKPSNKWPSLNPNLKPSSEDCWLVDLLTTLVSYSRKTSVISTEQMNMQSFSLLVLQPGLQLLVKGVWRAWSPHMRFHNRLH